MTYDIFSIDWITVDTIIILLLLILLLSVKLFKERYRWREEISSTNITKESLKNIEIRTNKKVITLKKLSIIKKQNLLKNNQGLILNFHLKSNKLMDYVTQGIANSGINVININLDSDIELKSKIGIREDDFISSILNEVKEANLKINIPPESKIIAIIYSKTPKLLFNITQCQIVSKVIVINPKNTKNLFKNTFDGALKGRILKMVQFIFSEKKFLFLKNTNIKNLKNNFDIGNSIAQNINIIHNATYSFKYYETILIGFLFKLVYNTFNAE